MIKAVLLDIDDTLLSFEKFVIESMKSGFKKFGIGEYSDEMFRMFNEINSKLWKDLEKGEISFEDLKKTRWNLVFRHMGVSADGEAFEKYFRECLFESAIPEDGAMELIEYLHPKYILCAASNGPYRQQVNRLKLCGMLPYFSHLFISEEIGSSKPSEEFFNACMERLNADPEKNILPGEVMMIGDSLTSDMAGGINAGMQTVTAAIVASLPARLTKKVSAIL